MKIKNKLSKLAMILGISAFSLINPKSETYYNYVEVTDNPNTNLERLQNAIDISTAFNENNPNDRMVTIAPEGIYHCTSDLECILFISGSDLIGSSEVPDTTSEGSFDFNLEELTSVGTIIKNPIYASNCTVEGITLKSEATELNYWIFGSLTSYENLVIKNSYIISSGQGDVGIFASWHTFIDNCLISGYRDYLHPAVHTQDYDKIRRSIIIDNYSGIHNKIDSGTELDPGNNVFYGNGNAISNTGESSDAVLNWYYDEDGNFLGEYEEVSNYLIPGSTDSKLEQNGINFYPFKTTPNYLFPETLGIDEWASY